MGTAVWVKSDKATLGDWVGAGYGSDGYNIITDASSYPGYATVSVTGNGSYGGSVTADTKDLVHVSNHAQRWNGGWYGNMTIDIALTSGTHRVGVYVYDFSNGGRYEKFEILDADNADAVLDTRKFKSLYLTPRYMFWNCSGHVKIRITALSGPNAVVSGIFFDAAGTPAAPGATAVFVGTDTATQGTWSGVYGADGAYVCGDSHSYPGYATVSPADKEAMVHVFANPSVDVRAPQKLSNTAVRINAIWYTGDTDIDIMLTGSTHMVSLYLFDGDSSGRAENISIFSIDDGESLLDMRSASAMYATPKWLKWNCAGGIRIRVTLTAGANFCVNGLFFDPEYIAPAGGGCLVGASALVGPGILVGPSALVS